MFVRHILFRLQDLPRRFKQLVLVGGDTLALPILLFMAWSLRLETWVWPSATNSISYIVVTAIGIVLLQLSGVYRTVVRAFDEHFLRSLMLAIILFSLAFFWLAHVGLLPVPRTVSFMTGFFLFIWVWASRSLLRFVLLNLMGLKLKRSPLLIYGAGQSGRQLARASLQAPDFHPLAFIDDDPGLVGRTVNGLPVYAGEQLMNIIKRFKVTDIIIAMPSATRSRRKQIIELLEPLPVHVRSLPGVDQLLRGDISFSDVQEVDIADLLGRDPVPPIAELMQRDIKNKVVMVTGAGGSIGSELCRQIIQLEPSHIVLWEHGEYSLYQIERELSNLPFKVKLTPVLGCVLNQERMTVICKQHRVDTIYHAAAYKHVPLVESNPFEGLRNNALGTFNAARAAMAAGVSKFVLISTDKAVRPTNIMGASKRLAELSLQTLAHSSTQTCFTMVRFGNVLGSSGSVVPLFRQQLAAGGPITVTHPEVTRYFMTIPEAAQLVIQAGAMASGGDVFVLDMGKSVRILDLARQMIHLSGLSERTPEMPDGDIEIQFTGLRPGEKLYEELLIGVGHVQGTTHHRIMKAFESSLWLDELEQIHSEIFELAKQRDIAGLKHLLQAHVEGYVPAENSDDVEQPIVSDVVPLRSLC